jgi:peptidoglycan-N-acetylglucosamine deacetylase
MIPRALRSGLKAALRRVVPTRYLVWNGSREGRRLALTFDDGPNAEFTPPILALLAEAGIPATFFVLGAEVEKQPELAAAMVAAGHELGNHTYAHANLDRVSWRRAFDELRGTDRLLRSLDPGFRGMFRPPRGRLGVAGAAYAVCHGCPAVMWTLDSRDHQLVGTQPLVERVAAAPLAGGDILLFHDDNAFTVEALAAVIQDLRERGFSFCRVSDLLRRG